VHGIVRLSFDGLEPHNARGGGHIGKLQNMGKAKTSAQEHVGYFHYQCWKKNMAIKAAAVT
jgi:hypothetical protein